MCVDGCAIGPTGSRALANAMAENSTLDVVCLGYNGFDLEGAKEVRKALSRNHPKNTLNLRKLSCAVTPSSENCRFLGDSEAKEIAAGLSVNRTLVKLNLGKQNNNLT